MCTHVDLGSTLAITDILGNKTVLFESLTAFQVSWKVENFLALRVQLMSVKAGSIFHSSRWTSLNMIFHWYVDTSPEMTWRNNSMYYIEYVVLLDMNTCGLHLIIHGNTKINKKKQKSRQKNLFHGCEQAGWVVMVLYSSCLKNILLCCLQFEVLSIKQHGCFYILL